MKKSKILILCLVCLLGSLLPLVFYEKPVEGIELVTPQFGSYIPTTKNGRVLARDMYIKSNSYYIHVTLDTDPVFGNYDAIEITRSTDLITWTTEFDLATSGSSTKREVNYISLCKDGSSIYCVFLLYRTGPVYDLGWCVSTDDGATWTNGSGGADGTYNLASSGDAYGLLDDSIIYSTCVISNVEYAILYSEATDTLYVIQLSDFSTIDSDVYDEIGSGDVSSDIYYFPAVLDGETSVKLIQFNGTALSTHSTISTDVDDLGSGKDLTIFAVNTGIFYIYTLTTDGVNNWYILWKYQDSTWIKAINDSGSDSIDDEYTFIVYDYTNNKITYVLSNNDVESRVYKIFDSGIVLLTYNQPYATQKLYGGIHPYISYLTLFYEWSYSELTDVSDCVIKKDGLASFNDYSPTTRFVEKQYVELYNSSNNLVYQGFITKIDRIDLIQKLVHLKALANYDLEKQLSDSYTTKTYYEMIETSIDTHALYLTYSLDHTPVTTYTMEHKKTLAELIKWGTKQESLKDYVTPATVLTIDDGTTDTTIDVSDVDGDVIDEYKSYEITYNPSIVILYGGFVNGVRITSTWRSTVIGDQPFSDNYPEVVDQTQLDNLAEAIGTGKDFKILVFEFTVFNKAYIQPGQQIDFQYTLDQTNYPVLASKAKYYVISNEINLSQDSQFIRISDALIDEAKGDQKNGLTVENAFQLVEQVQGNVNTLETDADSTYLKKTGVETQDLLLKDAEASALDIKEGANSYLKFTTSNGGEVITAGKPLAMGTNKITGLGAASSNGDAVRYEQLEGYVPTSLLKQRCTFVLECQDKANPVEVSYSDGSTYVLVSTYFNVFKTEAHKLVGSTPPTGMTRRFYVGIDRMADTTTTAEKWKFWDGTNVIFDEDGKIEGGATNYRNLRIFGPYDWTTYATPLNSAALRVSVCVKQAGKKAWYFGCQIIVEDYYA